MKWRNSKERELLSSGGNREATLPNKANPNPDLSDLNSELHLEEQDKQSGTSYSMDSVLESCMIDRIDDDEYDDEEDDEPILEVKEEEVMSPDSSGVKVQDDTYLNTTSMYKNYSPIKQYTIDSNYANNKQRYYIENSERPLNLVTTNEVYSNNEDSDEEEINVS